MEAGAIKTDEEHAAALERLRALMDAAPDTPEAAELEALATVIEQFEITRWPIALPPHSSL